MKIAMYNLTSTVATGGIETFNWEIALELSRRGHDVHLFGGNNNLDQYPTLPIHRYPYRPRGEFPPFGSRFQKLAERGSMARRALPDLVQGQYDILYISKPYDLPWALWAAKRSGAKVFFSSGGTEFFPGYGWLARRLDLFTACSQFNARQIEDYCGIKPVVLYNGVDIDLFSPRPVNTQLKTHFSPNGPIMFSAGRLKRVKGFEYAIQAIALIARRFPELRYLIAGDGSYRDHLVSCARECGITERVHFLGNIPHADLPDYYSIADAAIFPSIHSEAFGIAIAEAMSCGVPVVGTNIGGIPEVIGDSGWLVPPKDPETLAVRLIDLLENPQKRGRYGVMGQIRVKDHFTWKHAADIIEKQIDRLFPHKV